MAPSSNATDTQAIRLLVVEDNPGDARLIQEMLSEQTRVRYQLHTGNTLYMAMDFVRNNSVDIILLDLSLPDSFGLETYFRMRDVAQQTPIVVLTGADNEFDALEAMRHGVQDYLFKNSIDGELLSRVLRYAIERHQAKTALRKSEERLRAMIEGSADGMMLIDGKGAVHMANKAAAALLGMATGTMFCRPLDETAPWSNCSELTIETPGRQTRYIEVRLSPMDWSGDSPMYVGTLRDVSERRHAEMHLEREMGINVAIARISSEMLAPGKALDHIAQTIKVYARMLTQSECALVCEAPEPGGHGPDACDAMFKDLLLQRKIFFSNDLESCRPFAAMFPDCGAVNRILCVPSVGENELVGYVAVANGKQDYSEEDIEVVDRLATLFALAVQRQRAAQEQEQLNKQLLQAQKMESIGQLAGGVAHDFNNMLTVIMANTMMLGSKAKAVPEAAQCVAFINEACERAKDLTMKLLTYAREEKIRAQSMDIHEVIHSVAGMVRRSINKDIEISLQLQEGLPPVHADPSQILQALMNVCKNAFDAMPGGGRLEIETSQSDMPDAGAEAGAPCCRIRVRDTGSGIPDALLTRVTDPFFTTKGRGEGTGLGLSVSLGVIKTHGGHMRIGNRTDCRGAEVTMWLPFAGSETDCAPRRDPASVDAIPGGTETILLVDDEQQILTPVMHMLSHLGYSVLTACSGLEALDTFRRLHKDIDLVVLDMIMPGMHGEELFGELARIDSGFKSLIVSGFSREGKVEALLGRGAMGFVQKPFNYRVFARAIRRALDASRPHGEQLTETVP